jgi:hypothetical protein
VVLPNPPTDCCPTAISTRGGPSSLMQALQAQPSPMVASLAQSPSPPPSPTSSFVTVDRAEAEAVPFSYATSGGGIPSIRGDPMAASHPQAYPAPPAATVPVNHSSIRGDSVAVSHPQTHPAPPATTVPVIHDHTRPPAEMRWYAVVRGLCPGVHQGW